MSRPGFLSLWAGFSPPEGRAFSSSRPGFNPFGAGFYPPVDCVFAVLDGAAEAEKRLLFKTYGNINKATTTKIQTPHLSPSLLLSYYNQKPIPSLGIVEGCL
jgi:hypothetical protein